MVGTAATIKQAIEAMSPQYATISVGRKLGTDGTEKHCSFTENV